MLSMRKMPTLENSNRVVHDNRFLNYLPSSLHKKLMRRILCHIVVSVLGSLEFSDKSILDAILPGSRQNFSRAKKKKEKKKK